MGQKEAFSPLLWPQNSLLQPSGKGLGFCFVRFCFVFLFVFASADLTGIQLQASHGDSTYWGPFGLHLSSMRGNDDMQWRHRHTQRTPNSSRQPRARLGIAIKHCVTFVRDSIDGE